MTYGSAPLMPHSFGKRKLTKIRRRGKEKTMKKHGTLTWKLVSALVILTMLTPATLSVAPLPIAWAAETTSGRSTP